MTWNPAEPAHACLSFFEKWHHDHRSTLFTASGEWNTDFLIKSSANESQSMRDSKAAAHANLLDEVFTSLFRAQYENGVSKNAAIAEMETVLKDAAKKMKDMGDPVNAAYRFKGE